MYPRWTIAAVAVMVFALLVLSAAAQGPAKPSPEVVNVVTGNTEFGLALYSQLAGKEGSLFFFSKLIKYLKKKTVIQYIIDLLVLSQTLL